MAVGSFHLVKHINTSTGFLVRMKPWNDSQNKLSFAFKLSVTEDEPVKF